MRSVILLFVVFLGGCFILNHSFEIEHSQTLNVKIYRQLTIESGDPGLEKGESLQPFVSGKSEGGGAI